MHTCALDLSDSVIRLVTLKRVKGSLVMPVRGEVPVPPGVIVDGDIHQPTVVAELIHELWTAADPKLRRAVVSLPERHTFIKLMTLPVDVKNVDAEQVKAEAVQHVPFSWDEMQYDWSVLPQKNSHGQWQILFGAASKAMIETYDQAVAAAKLEPSNMVIESLAIARAMFRDDEPGAHIVLDLGRTRSTIILVHDGLVLFSATVRYAGKDLNRFIADQLHITDAEAEKAKTVFGLDPQRGQGTLRKVLLPHIDVLEEKISEVESFYTEHMIDRRPISSVLLTGSGSLMHGIDTELAARLPHPVLRQPSWIFRELQHADPTLPVELGMTYTTAVGLALETVAPL